ncbi:MipA/OmpV family protein [Acuticoccus yangtzensis]|uniref:MipA/OmpV family protein n=1 Tax=Acuticoccus yangtzensis TaxID=1443441 RepID=UPI000AE268BE|nr:MipA/OmpV family protein [Acuticoccus yangtzensis]
MRGFVSAAMLMAGTLIAGPALSADIVAETVPAPEAVTSYHDIIIDVGAGVSMEPTFPSSKTYGPSGYPLLALQYLRLPVFGEVVDGKEKLAGFSLFPSFNVVGERLEDDASYLEGVGDTDYALELGAGAAFRYGFLRAFGLVRYGVTGHNGFVGEAGVDVLLKPMERLEVSFGPRISAADGAYMDYYFSVPNSAVELSAYEADGGIKDVGFQATASYALTENWRLHGQLKYTHFVGEALDSPIVDAGNDQEIRVGVGLTYRFRLDLY